MLRTSLLILGVVLASHSLTFAHSINNADLLDCIKIRDQYAQSSTDASMNSLALLHEEQIAGLSEDVHSWWK